MTIMYLIMELIVQFRKIKIREKSSSRFAAQVVLDIALSYAKLFELGKSEMLNAGEKSDMHE